MLCLDVLPAMSFPKISKKAWLRYLGVEGGLCNNFVKKYWIIQILCRKTEKHWNITYAFLFPTQIKNEKRETFFWTLEKK